MPHGRQRRDGTLEDRVRPIKALPAIAIVVSWVLVATGPSALAAAGDLDSTFGSGGLVTTDFETDDYTFSYAYALAIQADGKIVAAGFAQGGRLDSFGLARYNVDGSLDTSFGGDGKITTSFGPGGDEVNALAFQPDGKIIAVGLDGSPVGFAIARYGLDGMLDPTFSGNGKATTEFGRRFNSAGAVVLQTDGKIVVAGSASRQPFGGPGKFALTRYDANGTLDATFSDDGKVTTDFTPGFDTAGHVEVQGDGTIVAVGTAKGGRSLAVALYDPDGTLDTTFSDDGKTTAGFLTGGIISTIAVQPDGRFVAAGFADDGRTLVVARYEPDGSLDVTFGEAGTATTPILDGFFANDVAIQADGKVVVAGAGSSSAFVLARYGPDGALDTAFGTDGFVVTDFSPYYDVAYGVAIQADGKIVAAGAANGSVFALARYLAS